MELRDYLRVVRRRWVIIVATTVVVVAAAAAYTLAATPMYASTVRMFITTQQTDTAVDAYQGGLFSQQRVKSYASLINGSEMANRVAEKMGDGITGEEVMAKLRTSVVPDTVVLSVSATDPSAERAQRIAQTAAEEFTEYVAQLETPPGMSTAPLKAVARAGSVTLTT